MLVWVDELNREHTGFETYLFGVRQETDRLTGVTDLNDGHVVNLVGANFETCAAVSRPSEGQEGDML